MNFTHMGPLRDGGTAVVVGGGPGGTAAAIALKQEAARLGRSIRVVIMEGKEFSSGRQHNQCAGVLSPPIDHILADELGVPFPMHLCQRAIDEYVLHTSRLDIVLNGAGESSYALRRVQFDAYMLETARQHGVEVLPIRFADLEIYPDRAVIYTESYPLEADVVIGAFGLDEGSAAIFQRAVGYHPPQWLNSVVTKYHPQEGDLKQFGGRIHVFLPTDPAIEFGAVTPKGNHLVINIAGTKVDAALMDRFFALPEVKRVLPSMTDAARLNPRDLTYFKGRFPCGLAKGYSGDRYIMVGDAAGLVRAFKGKGVTSAIQTGIRAARIIVREGISAEAFQSYQRANRDILEDLPYGVAMRWLTIFASQTGLMNVAIRAANHNVDLRLAFFDAVSAHRPYNEVVRRLLAPRTVASIVRALLGMQ